MYVFDCMVMVVWKKARILMPLQLEMIASPQPVEFPADLSGLKGKWYVHCKGRPAGSQEKPAPYYLRADGAWALSAPTQFSSASTAQKALARSNGTLAVAAKLLGVSRPTLYSLLDAHNLAAGDVADADGEIFRTFGVGSPG